MMLRGKGNLLSASVGLSPAVLTSLIVTLFVPRFLPNFRNINLMLLDEIY